DPVAAGVDHREAGAAAGVLPPAWTGDPRRAGDQHLAVDRTHSGGEGLIELHRVLDQDHAGPVRRLRVEAVHPEELQFEVLAVDDDVRIGSGLPVAALEAEHPVEVLDLVDRAAGQEGGGDLAGYGLFLAVVVPVCGPITLYSVRQISANGAVVRVNAPGGAGPDPPSPIRQARSEIGRASCRERE